MNEDNKNNFNFKKTLSLLSFPRWSIHPFGGKGEGRKRRGGIRGGGIRGRGKRGGGIRRRRIGEGGIRRGGIRGGGGGCVPLGRCAKISRYADKNFFCQRSLTVFEMRFEFVSTSDQSGGGLFLDVAVTSKWKWQSAAFDDVAKTVLSSLRI